MKEYNLIRKQGDHCPEGSEADTLIDLIHQDCEDSLNESSEVIVNTAKLVKSRNVKKNTSRRKPKRAAKDEESDSDFELPAYSTKSMVRAQRRVRKRLPATREANSGEGSICWNAGLNMDNSEEEVHKSDENLGDEEAFALTPEVEVEKKANNDSTHEGSICGKRGKGRKVLENSGIQVNQNLEASRTDFGKVSSKNTISPQKSNFEFLVNAAKIHSDMLRFQTASRIIDQPQISSAFGSVRGQGSLVNQTHSLDFLVNTFNNQNFNNNSGFGGPSPLFTQVGYSNLQ